MALAVDHYKAGGTGKRPGASGGESCSSQKPEFSAQAGAYRECDTVLLSRKSDQAWAGHVIECHGEGLGSPFGQYSCTHASGNGRAEGLAGLREGVVKAKLPENHDLSLVNWLRSKLPPRGHTAPRIPGDFAGATQRPAKRQKRQDRNNKRFGSPFKGRPLFAGTDVLAPEVVLTAGSAAVLKSSHETFLSCSLKNSLGCHRTAGAPFSPCGSMKNQLRHPSDRTWRECCRNE